jgi:hypothetical protein
MGDDLIALNDGSTVPNRGTKMLGDDSVATNRRPTVQNRGARELGDESVDSNRRPAILGRGTKTVGDGSVAVGDGSIARDSRSTLVDNATRTRGDGSVAVDDGSTLVDNEGCNSRTAPMHPFSRTVLTPGARGLGGLREIGARDAADRTCGFQDGFGLVARHVRGWLTFLKLVDAFSEKHIK